MRLISRTPLTMQNAVTDGDIADHLRITSTEAPSVMRFAVVAAQELEQFIPIALLSQTIVAQGIPERDVMLYLPVGPASAQTATVEAEDGTALPHLFTPGARPAVTRDEPHEGVVTVTYTACHGTETADVPADLAHAVLEQSLRLYDLRGDIEAPATPAPAFSRIAARYRRVSL